MIKLLFHLADRYFYIDYIGYWHFSENLNKFKCRVFNQYFIHLERKKGWLI